MNFVGEKIISPPPIHFRGIQEKDEVSLDSRAHCTGCMLSFAPGGDGGGDGGGDFDDNGDHGGDDDGGDGGDGGDGDLY